MIHGNATGDELILLGTNLEHQWAQPHEFIPREMDEITIQFVPGLVSNEILSYEPMRHVRQMLEDADKGIRFSEKTIQKVKPLIKRIAKIPTGLERLYMLFRIVCELANDDYTTRCSKDYEHSDVPYDQDSVYDTEFVLTLLPSAHA